jgi:hypothetical protein
MKLGIKVAPNNTSKQDLEQTHASFTEVWFNILEKDRYNDLFTILHAYAPHSGLHFWGALANGYMTSIAYPDTAVIRESMQLIRDTIDIASNHGFSYVNIHPGTRTLYTMNYQLQQYAVHTPCVPVNVAEPIFLENMVELTHYAQNHGILLTVETVPCRSANNWLKTNGRTDPIDLGELPIESLVHAQALGIAIANDFGHTAAFIPDATSDQTWDHLHTYTALLAAATRLIHIGFLIPPFNGTDCHDMLQNPLFETSHAIPNHEQILSLFRMFTHRPDIYALVEPREDHAGNYVLAKKLLIEAGVFDE